MSAPDFIRTTLENAAVAGEMRLFLNRLRSLHNIDSNLLPELTYLEWRSFHNNPARFLMHTADDTQAAAIWREVERRQRRTA